MTTRDDPLNEILLPAYDLAVRIRDGERNSKPSETLLAGALLVLLAERDSMLMLYKRQTQKLEEEREFCKELAEEAGPAATDRVRSYFRLRNRTGVVR